MKLTVTIELDDFMKTELQSMILRSFEDFYAWVQKITEDRSAELREGQEISLRIALISNEIINVFSDYGITVTIKHVMPSYQLYSFELEVGKRVSKKKILEAVKYDLYKRYNYKVSVDFSGCNPVVAVGVPSLPYIIHTKHLHYEPDYEAQLPIILGLKTSDGEVLQFDLAKSGNVLIGGALKQGKTICIKNMIYCLERCKSKPQIIIFDFKRCGEYK